jgi:hypothetical protein
MIPSWASYVTLHIENWMEKSQNISAWLSNMVLAHNYFDSFAEASKKYSKAVHLSEKSAINMISLVGPCF